MVLVRVRKMAALRGIAWLMVVQAVAVNCLSEPSDGFEEIDVIVIGAGTAGITAAKKFSERQVPFLILEASDRIGGRVRDGEFDGKHIELGANWLHDLDANPLWPIAQEIGLQGEIDDYDSVRM